MYDYLATYWLINGKAYPDTAPITATAGQRVLLRYVNAGYDNTTHDRCSACTSGCWPATPGC